MKDRRDRDWMVSLSLERFEMAATLFLSNVEYVSFWGNHAF